MRLSSDKKTELVSDDKYTLTYPMTSSIEAKFVVVIVGPIWSFMPTRKALVDALFDGCHQDVSASRMGYEMW